MNDKMVANMLIEARLCGMFVEELGELITEYITSDAETEREENDKIVRRLATRSLKPSAELCSR